MIWASKLHPIFVIVQCHKPAHINNPWFFRTIFINLLIIKFIIINVQIGRVYKHDNKPLRLDPYHVPQILNDIFFGEISTCKKNDNLLLAQIFTQRPFTCATSILGEKKWNLICHIWMLLVLYHPCMTGFIQINYPMGGMGVKDQCGLLTAHFHNVFHNFVLINPCFFISIMCM